MRLRLGPFCSGVGRSCSEECDGHHAAHTCYLGDRPVVFGETDAAWPDARSQCLVKRNPHSAIAVEGAERRTLRSVNATLHSITQHRIATAFR